MKKTIIFFATSLRRASDGNRTRDNSIKSRVLYQLSYRHLSVHKENMSDFRETKNIFSIFQKIFWKGASGLAPVFKCPSQWHRSYTAPFWNRQTKRLRIWKLLCEGASSFDLPILYQTSISCIFWNLFFQIFFAQNFSAEFLPYFREPKDTSFYVCPKIRIGKIGSKKEWQGTAKRRRKQSADGNYIFSGKRIINMARNKR